MTKRLQYYCALIMAVIMTNIPHMAWAEAAQEMIPTTAIVQQMSEAEARAKVAEFLNREDFKAELVKRGVNPQEVNARVAALSQHELQQLAAQMDQAQYGGDVGGILVLVVLVLLIIFLAKRI